MNDLVIDVSKLNKHFGDKHVVIDVNLKVKRGEIFGFLGPNGSGKTTTLRMICGLLTPDSGEGHCLGYDILTQSLEIKTHVGYMTQKFSLYEDLTVEENMQFIANIYDFDDKKRRIEETLDMLAFGSRRNQLAGSMSGGWKQRLALACSLLRKPKLLLLDEPTAGVDPKARRDFWDNIHHLSHEGVTTLVTTHYMDEAERCTRLGYIAYGNLLAEGKMSEVIRDAGLFTWQVAGEGISELAIELKKIPEIEQVAVFGEVLHVCGHDIEKMKMAISPFQKSPFEWKQIEPSIEDVFINLVGQTEDNF
ncbi:MAG: ABC transporter ATP-binding protein [Gammaproteobacteria bacterium]